MYKRFSGLSVSYPTCHILITSRLSKTYICSIKISLIINIEAAMKKFSMILTVLLAVLLFSASVSASSPLRNQKQISKTAIENLLAGLESDNLGLNISSAYMLGEYQCSKAVIPLLKMLKSSVREEARIAAALALYKIDDARGIFAVKQAIKFDDSDRVKKLCGLFYNEYSRPEKETVNSIALK